MISSYIFHVHTIYLARTLMSFMVVTGPDGNNSSCFLRVDVRFCLPSPLALLSLSLLSPSTSQFYWMPGSPLFRAPFGAPLHDIGHLD